MIVPFPAPPCPTLLVMPVRPLGSVAYARRLDKESDPSAAGRCFSLCCCGPGRPLSPHNAIVRPGHRHLRLSMPHDLVTG
jgi:hypothetical protein